MKDIFISVPISGKIIVFNRFFKSVFGLKNHYIEIEVVHHVLFLKFGGMTTFLILVLTNYKECGDDGSTHSIPQTKQK